MNLYPRYFVAMFTSICAMSTASIAHAEKADSQKPMTIDSRSTKIEGKTDTKTLDGSIEIIRGTLLIRGDHCVVTGENGKQIAVLTAAGKGQVSFRQKRDGGPDLWVEGVADRIEYDEANEIVKFFSRANGKYLDGKVVKQDLHAEYFSYDSVKDVFDAVNDVSGQQAVGAQRVKLILPPKTETKK